MSKNKLPYLIVTGLFCVGLLPSAVMNIVQPDFVVEVMQHMQLPMHLLALVGVWKLLGIAAIAASVVRPFSHRLTEWAYAGFFFDLTGAAYLHAAVGDYAGMPGSVVFLGLLVASYWLRPAAEATGVAATPVAAAA